MGAKLADIGLYRINPSSLIDILGDLERNAIERSRQCGWLQRSRRDYLQGRASAYQVIERLILDQLVKQEGGE